MKSYAWLSRSLPALIDEARLLYSIRTADMPGEARAAVDHCREVGALFARMTGAPLEGRRVLVVGFGQTLSESYCLGVGNHVTGIDLDVPVRGLRPLDYVRVARRNGPGRALKTLARKALGIDARFRGALRRALGVQRLREPDLREMNAESMDFPGGSFDLVYSQSVFQHLEDPARVLRECTRVLAPGGVLYVGTHLYTSETGGHDLRVCAGRRDGIPLWAHLRPAHTAQVVERCTLNRWRAASWEALFEARLPGVSLEYTFQGGDDDARLRAALADLRARGELDGYTDTELLAGCIVAAWRKPPAEPA